MLLKDVVDEVFDWGRLGSFSFFLTLVYVWPLSEVVGLDVDRAGISAGVVLFATIYLAMLFVMNGLTRATRSFYQLRGRELGDNPTADFFVFLFVVFLAWFPVGLPVILWLLMVGSFVFEVGVLFYLNRKAPDMADTGEV